MSVCFLLKGIGRLPPALPSFPEQELTLLMALTGEVGAKSTKLTVGSGDGHAARRWACVPSPTVTGRHFMFPEQFLEGKKRPNKETNRKSKI